MFNVELKFQGKVVLCKEFSSKQGALRFIKSIKDSICFACKIALSKREENGKYVYLNTWSY